MRRALWILGMAAALAVPATGLGAPDDDDAHGPRCADFVIMSPDYRTNVVTGEPQLTLTIAMEGGEPSCLGGEYEIVVRDASGYLLAKHTFVGDGITEFFQYTTTITGGPSPIIVSAESKYRAPNAWDTATVTMILDGGGGATHFR